LQGAKYVTVTTWPGPGVYDGAKMSSFAAAWYVQIPASGARGCGPEPSLYVTASGVAAVMSGAAVR
jgi:hypothetical protein